MRPLEGGGGGRGEAASGESSARRLGRPGTKPKHSAGSARHVAPGRKAGQPAFPCDVQARAPEPYRCAARGVSLGQRPGGVRPGSRRVTTTRRPGESPADQGHGRTAGKGFPSRPPAQRRAGRHGKPATPRAARGQRRRPERPLSYHDGNRGRFSDRREDGRFTGHPAPDDLRRRRLVGFLF